MLRRILRIILILILTYLFFVTGFIALQKRLIFHPELLQQDLTICTSNNCEEVWIRTSDGRDINGLLFKGSGKEIILYFHGNSGSLRTWKGVYENFKSLNHSMLIIDYGGFGKSMGKISQENLFADALVAYKYIRQIGYAQDDIILYGRSIGTAMAIHLASEAGHKAMILESPFTDMATLVRSKIPIIPVTYFLAFPFDNKENLMNYRSPVLILCGKDDHIIPVQFSQAVYDMLDSPKKMVLLDGTGHNNIEVQPQFIVELEQFLERL